jgi:hypothetical protein
MVMNPAMALIAAYIVITAILQFVGFLISLVVDKLDPTLSLLTFVILFLVMFWVAWPLAVRVSFMWIPAKPGPSNPSTGG